MKRMVERPQLALDATDAAALVLDWSRDPEWRSAVSSIEVEPAGRARPGQGIRETLRFAGFRFVTPSAITGADASSASFAGASGTVAVSGRRTVVADEEGCTVVLELEVAMTGAMAFLER